MTLLLDTNVVLFAGADPSRLGRIADLLDTDRVLVSPVVTWEIAIKASIGRLHLHTDPDSYVEEARTALRGEWLPLTNRHAGAVATLPFHHRDPFDRLLVAVARLEDVALATTDARLGVYDVELVLP